MSFASGTATRAEVITLKNAVAKLDIMLRGIAQGEGKPLFPGNYTAAQVDTQVTAVSAAITAVNA